MDPRYNVNRAVNYPGCTCCCHASINQTLKSPPVMSSMRPPPLNHVSASLAMKRSQFSTAQSVTQRETHRNQTNYRYVNKSPDQWRHVNHTSRSRTELHHQKKHVCGRCGGKETRNHTKQTCHYKQFKCWYCNKVGHKQTMCFSKLQNGRITVDAHNTTNHRKTQATHNVRNNYQNMMAKLPTASTKIATHVRKQPPSQTHHTKHLRTVNSQSKVTKSVNSLNLVSHCNMKDKLKSFPSTAPSISVSVKPSHTHSQLRVGNSASTSTRTHDSHPSAVNSASTSTQTLDSHSKAVKSASKLTQTNDIIHSRAVNSTSTSTQTSCPLPFIDKCVQTDDNLPETSVSSDNATITNKELKTLRDSLEFTETRIEFAVEQLREYEMIIKIRDKEIHALKNNTHNHSNGHCSGRYTY